MYLLFSCFDKYKCTSGSEQFFFLKNEINRMNG